MILEDVIVLYSIGLVFGIFLSGCAFILGEAVGFAIRLLKRG